MVLVPQVFPLPRGGVQLEWHAGPTELEVSVEANGRAVVTAVKAGVEQMCELEAYWPGMLPQSAVDAFADIVGRVWQVRPLHS